MRGTLERGWRERQRTAIAGIAAPALILKFGRWDSGDIPLSPALLPQAEKGDIHFTASAFSISASPPFTFSAKIL